MSKPGFDLEIDLEIDRSNVWISTLRGKPSKVTGGGKNPLIGVARSRSRSR